MMIHGKSGTKMIVAALIAGFFLVSMSSSADAGWGHHRHWRGYRHHSVWPSYRSYSYFGHYGYGYRSFGYRHHFSYYPSYYYTPAYYAPTYYAPTYYTPSYYVPSAVGCGCCSTTSVNGYSVGYSADSVSGSRVPLASDGPITSFKVATRDQRAKSGEIELKINVPKDARVTINDRLTATTGTERAYVVRGAKPNDQYQFVVTAEVERNGKLKTETKTVSLRSGQVSLLAFDMDAELKPISGVHDIVSTTLKLQVPDNAKVFLAGYEMKQKSGARVFETTKLAVGEEINYTVRVDIDEDGKVESREKQLTLVGGQSQELAFDFDPQTRLAAR